MMNGELEFSKLNGKEKDFLKRLYKYLVEKNILVSLNKSTKEVDIQNKLNTYFGKLKVTNERSRRDLEYGKRLRDLYYANYVIKKENIPDSYYVHLAKKYQDEGYGIYDLVNPTNNTEKSLRDEHVNRVIKEQKDSLDSWLNYLMNEVSDYMPMWAKVWAFTGMLKIGNYDRESNKYMNRRKDSVSPFVSIDSEVLNQTIEYLLKYLNKDAIQDSELETLVSSESFAKIYGTLLLKKTNIKTNGNEGIWIKYNGFSDDYEKVYDSLQGYNTGWCTAGSISTTQEQLNGGSSYPGGDFYVYYSIDENGKYKIPRIAIRMDGNQIGEIRGVAKDQNLEPGLEDILNQKLQEFPDKDTYLKRTSDMKKLTHIYDKYQTSELTKEELRFLYEIDSKIDGFGWVKDPRIDTIKKERNIKKDLSIALDYLEEEIQIEPEPLSESCKYYCGNLNLRTKITADGLHLPQIITGNLNLYHLINAEGLNLPDSLGGSLFLSSLRTLQGLKLPDSIEGDLDLSGLKEIDELNLPKNIGEDLDLSSLYNVNKINFPNSFRGSIYLDNLTKANELIFPEVVRDLNLTCLTTVNELKLPKVVKGNFNLDSFAVPDSLKLPEVVEGDLYLYIKLMAKGLKLPQTIGGDLYLKGLIMATDLNLPERINGSLDLSDLTTANGLRLPEEIRGNLYLRNLCIDDLIDYDVKIPNNFFIIRVDDGSFKYDEFMQIYNNRVNERHIAGKYLG